MSVASFVWRGGIARGWLEGRSWAVLLGFRNPAQQEHGVRDQPQPCYARCCSAKALRAWPQTLRGPAETVDNEGDETQKYAHVAAGTRKIRVQPCIQATRAQQGFQYERQLSGLVLL